MIKQFAFGIAAASLAFTAAPAFAQDGEEPPRTTYRIEYLNFSGDGSAAWNDVMEKYVTPARKELGFPEEQVHWLMAGDWEIMIVTEMPNGLAVLDKHRGGRFAELEKNIVARFGSEEEAKAMKEKIDASITRRMVTYSHTHP